MAKLIDGKKIARKILDGLKEEVGKLTFKPLFCDILIGDDAVSESYVRIKGRQAESVGIDFLLKKLPNTYTTEAIITEIKKIQEQPDLCGLIVQLPLPQSLNKEQILTAIDPKIDVDCLNSENLKKFYSNNSKIIPPTAAAIVYLLESLDLDLFKSDILVVGQGELVGKPVSHLLKNKGYKVIVADQKTADLKAKTIKADVIISATGQPNLITGNMIKTNAVVIDAGTAESDGGIVGDVETDSVGMVASLVSPVPGGVGPVTVAMLLRNIVEVAKRIKN